MTEVTHTTETVEELEDALNLPRGSLKESGLSARLRAYHSAVMTEAADEIDRLTILLAEARFDFDRIEILDQAMGHELTWQDASVAVEIASKAKAKIDGLNRAGAGAQPISASSERTQGDRNDGVEEVNAKWLSKLRHDFDRLADLLDECKTAMTEAATFLDNIEGAGYGGMASFENARRGLRALLSRLKGEGTAEAPDWSGKSKRTVHVTVNQAPSLNPAPIDDTPTAARFEQSEYLQALIGEALEAAERRGIERAAEWHRDEANRIRALPADPDGKHFVDAMRHDIAAAAILALSPSHVETAEERQAKIMAYLRRAADQHRRKGMVGDGTTAMVALVDAIIAIERGDFDRPTERDK